MSESEQSAVQDNIHLHSSLIHFASSHPKFEEVYNEACRVFGCHVSYEYVNAILSLSQEDRCDDVESYILSISIDP